MPDGKGRHNNYLVPFAWFFDGMYKDAHVDRMRDDRFVKLERDKGTAG